MLILTLLAKGDLLKVLWGDKMNRDNVDKEYKSFKIPEWQQLQEGQTTTVSPSTKNDVKEVLGDGLFYEIEYDSCPIEGVGKFVLQSQKVQPPQKDEIRELFYRMRDIATAYRSPFTNYSTMFDKSVQQDNAKVFYKQAVFMKSFEDAYPSQVPFSSYFPYYQMLGYEQLRTYFTWRTQVRKGIVCPTSLSYVILYIYELLHNIGVESPQDGLDKLMSFWMAFKQHDASIDQYMVRWVKDYHIYYNLPQAFKHFTQEYDLTQHYLEIADPEDRFDLFCSISKYDIRKSIFFCDETSKLITHCFYFVMQKIREGFDAAGMQLDDVLFCPTKRIVTWKPFKDALFYQWIKQPDRKVVLSADEIYICSKNKWTFSTLIAAEKDKQFIGYVIKKMESVLRVLTNFRFKITANIDLVNPQMLDTLKKSGVFIETIIQNAVVAFYTDATKTVVTVDHAALARIRQEALVTQEALIVEEQTEGNALPPHKIDCSLPDHYVVPDDPGIQSAPVDGNWGVLKDVLTQCELQALLLILQGGDIKQFADDANVMLEVLADGMNQKAMDCIGDNLLDDQLMLYEDYEQQVKGMVES